MKIHRCRPKQKLSIKRTKYKRNINNSRSSLKENMKFKLVAPFAAVSVRFRCFRRKKFFPCLTFDPCFLPETNQTSFVERKQSDVTHVNQIEKLEITTDYPFYCVTRRPVRQQQVLHFLCPYVLLFRMKSFFICPRRSQN